MFPQKQPLSSLGVPSSSSSSSPSSALASSPSIFTPASNLSLGDLSLDPSHNQQSLLPPTISPRLVFDSTKNNIINSYTSPPISLHDQQQRQHRLQQQRLILQQQQQQAHIQLQNIQLRQKKALIEQQNRQLAEKQQQLSQRAPSSSLSPQSDPASLITATVSTPSLTTTISSGLPVTQTPSQPQPQQQQTPTSIAAITLSPSFPSYIHPNLNTGHPRPSPPPNLLSPSMVTTASMDIMALAPFPLLHHHHHHHHSQHHSSVTTSNALLVQQPIQHSTQQHQQQHRRQSLQQRQLQSTSSSSTPPLPPSSSQSYHHSLQYVSNPSGQGSQSSTNLPNMILNTMPESNPNGGSLWHSSTSILSSHNDFHSRGNNDELNSKESDNIMDLNSYTLDARILQKKDQIEELSPSGQILLAPTVEEVRTGQQFLINLQLSAPLASLATLGAPSPSKYPTMRVDRREAINTAGKPRAKDEPLTLQIIVHLANSGQIRKGACAKCCHKYGPSSPILVLLDPLSPSSTDPTSFSHIDSSAGSVTILAKVICSSTDHGERGNKDRYLFEFRLKRTNRSKSSSASRGGMVDENDKDTIASCVTAPIMCSGHHKAKRIYPTQRAAKTTKEGGPTAKVKTIKHQKSINVDAAFRSSNLFSDQQPYGRSGSMSSISNYPSPFSYVQDNLHSSSMASNLGDDQSNSDLDAISSVGGRSRQPSLLNATYESSSASFSHQFPPQPPRIFEVRPDQGPIRKMTDVVLRGLFFRDGMIPYFGCFPAQDIVVETSNLIICKAPETPLPGTVSITIYDTAGTQFSDLAQFTYTDDSETELLILQLQLRMAHRALEYLHTQATGQRGNANEILRDIPGLSQSGSRNGSPSGGGTMLIAEGEGADMGTAESETLTLEQVEEGILKTLDQLPGTVDLSMQLKNQGNMLHLSVLLGFHKLATRLIEEGCELEAQDVWAMTPLMYAVVKGCESIVKALVLAGATSSGARTPKEFYSCLPRAVDPTQAVVGYISIACTRHSSTTRALIAGSVSGKSDTVQIENDYGPFASSSSSDEDSDMAEEGTADTQAVSSTTDMPAAAATSDNGDEDEAETMSKIAEAIRGVYINHDMPPLDQQNLPPMHTVGPDGSIVVNNKVLKGDEIPRGVVPPESNTQSDNNESGYYSGVYSEVQDRLSHLSRAALPSEDVHMIVEFKKGPSQPAAASSSTSSAPVVAAPENLFRTGDTFSIEIRLATVPMPGSTLPAVPLPSEFLGIRLPHEMVKRVQQEQPVSILNEMTYNLNMSIQLGKNPMTDPQEHEHAHQQEHDHGYQGDGILLPGACTSCSKLLHEHKRISPSRLSKEDSSLYPILQFHVPSVPTLALLPEDADTSTNVDLSSGVMEVRNGHLEVKARVNCSSLHHLIQREKARRTAEMQQQQHEHQEREARPSSSSTPSLVRTRMDLKEIEDPGFVFSFELIHPTKNTVVAKFETDPILFQTYSRGRH